MPAACLDPFKQELVELIPQIRAFARTLSRNLAYADDLAQDALLNALQHRDSYTLGTNLKAWVFTILRNRFYSDQRRAWREQPLNEEEADRTLLATDDPEATLQLDEIRRALSCLPDEQREALILVGAGGLTYQQTGEIVECALGTVKSRVSRARKQLSDILADERHAPDRVPPSRAMDLIMREVAQLSRSSLAA